MKKFIRIFSFLFVSLIAWNSYGGERNEAFLLSNVLWNESVEEIKSREAKNNRLLVDDGEDHLSFTSKIRNLEVVSRYEFSDKKLNNIQFLFYKPFDQEGFEPPQGRIGAALYLNLKEELSKKHGEPSISISVDKEFGDITTKEQFLYSLKLKRVNAVTIWKKENFTIRLEFSSEEKDFPVMVSYIHPDH